MTKAAGEGAGYSGAAVRCNVGIPDDDDDVGGYGDAARVAGCPLSVGRRSLNLNSLENCN